MDQDQYERAVESLRGHPRGEELLRLLNRQVREDGWRQQPEVHQVDGRKLTAQPRATGGDAWFDRIGEWAGDREEPANRWDGRATWVPRDLEGPLRQGDGPLQRGRYRQARGNSVRRHQPETPEEEVLRGGEAEPEPDPPGAEAVRRAVACLPRHLQETYFLLFREQVPLVDAARQTNVTRRTVYNRRKAILRELKSLLARDQ